MWAIADQDDPNAVFEFEKRYPRYANELFRRLKAVDALKASGKTLPSASVPVFKNVSAPKPNYGLPVLLTSAAILAVSVFAFFTGSISSRSETQSGSEKLVETTAPKLEIQMSSELPKQPTLVPRQPVQPYIPQPQPIQAAPIEPSGSKEIEMHLESAPLHAAIQLIAQAGKLKVTIAPGLANPNIKIDYDKMTALQMLQALGKDYAFTPLMDGEREILVLPARDEDMQSGSGNRLN
jgi:hypothetical protein